MSCPGAFGAAVEPEPSLNLTPQQKELIRSHPLVSRTTLEALEESKHPFEDEKISCQICHNPYLIPAAVDEESERPFMTACGHIFGQNCFRKWVESCKETHHPLDCPTCRCPLLHRMCRHEIAILPAFCPTTPKICTRETIPNCCLACRYRRINHHRSELCWAIFINEENPPQMLQLLEDTIKNEDYITRHWTALLTGLMAPGNFPTPLETIQEMRGMDLRVQVRFCQGIVHDYLNASPKLGVELLEQMRGYTKRKDSWDISMDEEFLNGILGLF